MAHLEKETKQEMVNSAMQYHAELDVYLQYMYSVLIGQTTAGF